MRPVQRFERRVEAQESPDIKVTTSREGFTDWRTGRRAVFLATPIAV